MEQAAEEFADDDFIDIEEIMREIREKILAQQAALEGTGSSPLRIKGERLPPAYYEHLYEAGLAYRKIATQVNVQKSGLPLLGPLLDRLRLLLHQLIVYYVNQVATRQADVNSHLLQALNELGDALEAEADGHES